MSGTEDRFARRDRRRPARSALAGALWVLASAGAALAQGVAALEAKEEALRAEAVLALTRRADALEAQKQWADSAALRYELIGEYDPDDEHARQKLGFVRVGGQWHRDADALVIETNGEGNRRELAKLDRAWKKAAKELADAHQELARAWVRLSMPDRAVWHYRRLLALRPGDREAIEGLDLIEFEGFLGTEKDRRILRRSRLIEDAVAYLEQRDFPVIGLGDQRLSLLQKAGIDHRGARSRHFTVWGTLPEDQLVLAARSAERSLLLFRSLFGVLGGERREPRSIRDLILLPDQASYKAVLDACSSQFDENRRRFLEREVDLFYPAEGDRTLRCYKIENGILVVLDQSVRGVVQDALGAKCDGLWEGIGHAFCGFFFDRTLTFLIEQQSGHTVTSWRPKPLVPDLKVWREIASDTAWSRADTPTSRLVLVNAARFSNEERVKAWAICDWLVRWRPDLVVALDESRTDEARAEPDVEREFLARTGLSLPGIDRSWRDFWSKEKPLRDALARDPLGTEKELEAAARIGMAIDDARTEAEVGPLGWRVARGAVAKDALSWLAQRARALEWNRKRPQRAKPMPERPAGLAERVLCSAARDPAEAVAFWLRNPSSRDRLLHPGRPLVAVASSRDGILLDLTDPVDAITKGAPLPWPSGGQRNVPVGARVADLGRAAARALSAEGRKPFDQVGMPLSLHFFHPLPPGSAARITCLVLDGARALEGRLLALPGEGDLDEAAPGCLAFVPLAPLPRGTEITVRWTCPAEGRRGEDRRIALSFRTAEE